MSGHRERLLKSWSDVRNELRGEVGRFPTDQDMDWAPAEGMKSYRGLIGEMAVMETLTMSWLMESSFPDWQETTAQLEAQAGTPADALAMMERVRSTSLQYLEAATEELLETPAPLPPDWVQYFGGPEAEPEELLRWVVMHEYYHLGQIISYRWIEGDNPYKRG